MASTMGKIVLKNSTKMTLNERFTAYQEHTQSSVSSVRQKAQQQRQASAKNMRLAQQMANRPSVMAALKLKKRSLNLKQRLGSRKESGGPGRTNVKARLSFGATKSFQLQNRFGTSSGGRGKVSANRSGVRKAFGRGSGRQLGTSPMLKARLGNQSAGGRWRTPIQQTSNSPKRGAQWNKLRSRGNRGFQTRGRNVQGFRRGGTYNQQRRNFRRFRRGGRGQNFRGNRGRGQGRGIGRGQGRGANKKDNLPSKQELDNQLDEYMANTKNALDAELDAYMAKYGLD
ncbi:uncharacterized protein LOC143249789 isoform X2 [Tachypleus tridentatus]